LAARVELPLAANAFSNLIAGERTGICSKVDDSTTAAE